MNSISYDDIFPETESEKEDQPKLKTSAEETSTSLYSCHIGECKKIFKNKRRFEKHISAHLCEKRFKCEYENCSKVYKTKENLTLHIKNKHLLQKPYKCRYCENLFSHRNGKIYHERKIHKNEMTHQCQCNSF